MSLNHHTKLSLDVDEGTSLDSLIYYFTTEFTEFRIFCDLL